MPDVRDPDAVHAALARCEGFVRARDVAAELLGITPQEAAANGSSMEVAKTLGRLVREGRARKDYGPVSCIYAAS